MAQATRGLAVFALFVVAGLPCGCEQPGGFPAQPPPEVTVSRPEVRTVTEYAEFTGTTEAVESVEVRARVEGFLESVHFEAGATVEEGDLLFVIDSKPYQAKLDQAEAELASRQAELKLAEHDHKRVERLYNDDTASEFEWVKARSSWEAAKAMVQAAEAAVDEARLNLGYTRILAPISGRISRKLVDAGNLVGAGEYTLLTTIVKDDPIYAYFSASERTLLQYLEKHPEKRRPTEPQEPEPLYLGLSNEEGFPHEGWINWADNRVDASTGTIPIRGVFLNPDHVLLPGLFVRLRAPVDEREGALLITDRAVGADQGGQYLLVVDDQNMVEKRHVEIGSLLDGMRVIEKGLAPEDWVVTKGVQRAREGMKVNAARSESPTSAASAEPGPS